MKYFEGRNISLAKAVNFGADTDHDSDPGIFITEFFYNCKIEANASVCPAP